MIRFTICLFLFFLLCFFVKFILRFNLSQSFLFELGPWRTMMETTKARSPNLIWHLSLEYMPLFLSLASLVNGICWTAYALIKFDLYITGSNYNQHVKFQSLFTSVRSTVSLERQH
ncbi:hypothetical protein GQ55_7G315600 [Panicum hallii var. hallii]|uniref:Uncharacterized protein n=1 Tax=Panicum hallii var. hallii TaxID=1504633 RepID=A0A2T7D165_9POAL|nr:hypothetical protein GQ55_7G315600 [Panicum hallii var. hallii]